jgi:hypothetical protein
MTGSLTFSSSARSAAGTLAYAAPLLSTAVLLAGGERLTPLGLVGCALIVVCAAGIVLDRPPNEPVPTSERPRYDRLNRTADDRTSDRWIEALTILSSCINRAYSAPTRRTPAPPTSPSVTRFRADRAWDRLPRDRRIVAAAGRFLKNMERWPEH